MELTYIGHSCFKIKNKDLTLIIDPYDGKKTGFKLPKLEADIVLLSHQHEDHNFVEGITDHSLIINTPGEYEKGGVFVRGFESFHDASNGSERGKNIMYYIDIDNVGLMHLGDLGHELNKETLEKIPQVDVLLIPVGGTYTINAKTAAKVISSIEPGIVVPMHFQTDDLTGLSQKLDKLEKFLDEMGVDDKVKPQDKLKITEVMDAPEETELVVLTPQH